MPNAQSHKIIIWLPFQIWNGNQVWVNPSDILNQVTKVVSGTTVVARAASTSDDDSD